MLEEIKAKVNELNISPDYTTKLLSYIDENGQDILSKGAEYRLYNMLYALSHITDTKIADTLAECIFDNSQGDRWGAVENYCYDFYALNSSLLM